MTSRKDDRWRAANEGKRPPEDLPLFEIRTSVTDPKVLAGWKDLEIAPASAFAAGLAGSEAAARAWTPDEVVEVDKAIRRAAWTSGAAGFTADDVWALIPHVPVTKGLSSRLNAAARAGWIRNTGETRTAGRGGKHDHGQRLSVWQGT